MNAVSIYLSKFPVTRNDREYAVDVYEQYVCLGMYQWVVEIKEKVSKRATVFNRKGYRFKKVKKYHSGWSGYKEWQDKLIDLVQYVFLTWEEEKYEKNRREQAIIDFEAWDGLIK